MKLALALLLAFSPAFGWGVRRAPRRRPAPKRVAAVAAKRHWWQRRPRPPRPVAPKTRQPKARRPGKPWFWRERPGPSGRRALASPAGVETPPARLAPLPWAARPGPARRPPLIRNPKRLLTDKRAPRVPRKDEHGRPILSKPVQAPPAAHAAIAGNRTFVTDVVRFQKSETVVNNYYWHNDGGVRYCHYWDGRYHWYGFYSGPNYYWTRYWAGRWWWYDQGYGRWDYYYGGNWWWQNPVQPQVVYVYAGGGYAPYSDTTPAQAQAEAPAAPRFHSDVDTPDYKAKERDDSYALVVGVENYSSLPKAEFADRDAQAVQAHAAALGYPARNTVVLTDDRASLSAIKKYVEDWLPNKTDAKSRVLVYFAGHGAPDPGSDGAYLVPWDGDLKYLPATGYPLERLYKKLNALPAKRVVVVLDSCFSGAGGRSVLAEGARPLVTRVDTGRSAAGRLIIFTAAGSDEITGAAAGQGHGLFTYYFLKGLNGAARSTSKGITVQDLYDYLAPNVEDAARRGDNRDQDPQLLVPPDGSRQYLIKDLR